MNDKERPIVALKITMEVFENLDKFLISLIQTAEKYEHDFHDANAFSMADKKDVEKLTEILSKEKMAEFLIMLSEVFAAQEDFLNYNTYDKSQLMQFQKKLTSIRQKLDKVLEGL